MPEWFGEPRGEAVRLSEADPSWPEAATAWAVCIRAALTPTPARIEHIGSTAVPGLAAKPVIDLLVSVPEAGDEAAYRPGLESLGLVLRQRESDHRFFRPPASMPRTVHVHVCGIDSAREQDLLCFRDRLRADPGLARRHAELKRGLAERAGHDRAAYTEGKAAFIREVIGRA